MYCSCPLTHLWTWDAHPSTPQLAVSQEEMLEKQGLGVFNFISIFRHTHIVSYNFQADDPEKPTIHPADFPIFPISNSNFEWGQKIAMFKPGSVSKPCTPVVHIKIAGIYVCSSP